MYTGVIVLQGPGGPGFVNHWYELKVDYEVHFTYHEYDQPSLPTMTPSLIPLLHRAAAYIKLQDFQKALVDCKKAVELDPQYARAHGRLG